MLPIPESGKPSRVSLLDPSLVQRRAIPLRICISTAIVLNVLLWLVFCLLFGSGFAGTDYSSTAKVWVVDLDGDVVGSALVASAPLASSGTINGVTLDVTVLNVTTFATLADVQAAVDTGVVWAAVVATSGATQRMRDAAAGTSDIYLPGNALAIVYDAARSPATLAQLVLPPLQAVLIAASQRVALANYATYVNATASVAMARAVAAPVQWATNVLHSGPPVVSTATAVGLIFLWLIPMFTLMSMDAAAGPLESAVHIKQFLAVRYIVAASLHLIEALWFVCLVAIFRGSFVSNFGTAWMFVWLVMMTFASVGCLVTSLLPPPFGLWLTILVVVLNVAGGAFGTDLSVIPRFFWYGYGFPMFNANQGLRTIFTGAFSQIGYNLMVLFLWLIVCGTALVYRTYGRIAAGIPAPGAPPPPPLPQKPVSEPVDAVISPTAILVEEKSYELVPTKSESAFADDGASDEKPPAGDSPVASLDV
jgi:hypothetical protein